MREKADYRENLRRLDEKYPGVELLSLRQVADYTGFTPRTAKKAFGSELIELGSKERRSFYMSKAKLARLIS